MPFQKLSTAKGVPSKVSVICLECEKDMTSSDGDRFSVRDEFINVHTMEHARLENNFSCKFVRREEVVYSLVIAGPRGAGP